MTEGRGKDVLTERRVRAFHGAGGVASWRPRTFAFAGVKDGDRVLDVGTGTGALATALEAATTSE